MNVEVAVERVRAEFAEMPGMTLTVPQASRLFGLDPTECRRIVDRLVSTSYLRWTQSGAFTRAGRQP